MLGFPNKYNPTADCGFCFSWFSFSSSAHTLDSITSARRSGKCATVYTVRFISVHLAVSFLLSLGSHLGFQELRIFCSVLHFLAHCYYSNNFRLNLCSFGRVLVAFVIFILSLGRHLGFLEFHNFAFHRIGESITYWYNNFQVHTYSFRRVLAMFVHSLLSLGRHLGFL